MKLVLTPLLNIYSSIPGYALKTTSIAKIMKSAGSGANSEKTFCCKHQWQVTIHNCKSGPGRSSPQRAWIDSSITFGKYDSMYYCQ